MENDKIFQGLLDLYKQKKLVVDWGRASFNVALRDVTKEEKEFLEQKHVKSFVLSFLEAVSEQVLNGNTHEKYGTYVNQLLEEDKELATHVLIQTFNSSNICRYYNTEVLTKRDKNFNIVGYSLLLKLEIEKSEQNIEPIIFELSLKDLREFHNKLGEIINKIEKIE